MKGYKAFNKDLTCRGFQYEIGKEYEMEEAPIPCERGFHFCKSIADCYKWYATSDDTRICEVEALGDVETDDEVKYCTNKIRIVAEVTDEWQRKGNSSSSSSGYRNSGDWNSGDRNSGDWNSGYRNSGDRNSGDWNSGDMNSGDRNSGDWNSGRFASGVFNTDKNPKIKMFDKDSDWSIEDWYKSDARAILNRCPYSYSDFIWKNDMSEEEVKNHPECETIGGYIKVINVTNKDKQKWWDGLSAKDKGVVMALPNFDKDKFRQCTGIEIGE